MGEILQDVKTTTALFHLIERTLKKDMHRV